MVKSQSYWRCCIVLPRLSFHSNAFYIIRSLKRMRVQMLRYFQRFFFEPMGRAHQLSYHYMTLYYLHHSTPLTAVVVILYNFLSILEGCNDEYR